MNAGFHIPHEHEAETAAMPYDPDAITQQSDIAAVLARQQDQLLAIDGVEGVGIGTDSGGDAALEVFIREPTVADQLPNTIEGYPLIPVITGEITAL